MTCLQHSQNLYCKVPIYPSIGWCVQSAHLQEQVGPAIWYAIRPHHFGALLRLATSELIATTAMARKNRPKTQNEVHMAGCANGEWQAPVRSELTLKDRSQG